MKKQKFTLISFLCLFSSLCAQDNKTLKPIDIFEMEGVSDPQISPDGSQILYVRSGSDVMKDKRYSNIWIIQIILFTDSPGECLPTMSRSLTFYSAKVRILPNLSGRNRKLK